MVKDYLMIIGSRDSERFRRFRAGHDQKYLKLKSIKKLYDIENIWAIGPSTSDDLWYSIRKGDRIFFAENGTSFSHCGIVHGKVINRSIATSLWGDSPRIREHKRLVLFSNVRDVQMPFYKTCRHAGVTSPTATNLYLSKNRITPDWSDATPAISGTIIVSDDGAPNKKTEVVTRFIRDTAKVKKLKVMYHDECQICGHTIRISAKSRYSEVHHLHPLQDGGDDDYGNMIVLCPTHHVEFDYKVIGIDHDKKRIIDSNCKTIGNLTMSKAHKLDVKNIRFHLEGMGIP